MRIQDGVGEGIFAQVRKSSKSLVVSSIMENQMGYASRVDQQAFAMNTPKYAITTSEHDAMVICNNETEKYFLVQAFIMSNNGGSSNHNRTFDAKLYKNTAVPTTGIYGSAIIPFGNLNLGSSKVTSLGAYLWDGSTGTGLNGTRGDLMFGLTFSQGMSLIDFLGTFIIAPAQKIRLTLTGEETGTASCAVTGYLLDPSKL